MAAAHAHVEHGFDPTHDFHAHVVPIPVLLAVFAVLIVLTALTYAATFVDLGAFNIWIALLIAVVKGSAVALWFMHLRYDKPFYGVVLATSLLFVALFIGISLMDTLEYRVEYKPGATTVATDA